MTFLERVINQIVLLKRTYYVRRKTLQKQLQKLVALFCSCGKVLVKEL